MGNNRRTRRASRITTGAAAFALAGSFTLGFPGMVQADTKPDTKTVKCGETVTAAIGDKIVTTFLGLPVQLGIVDKDTDILRKTLVGQTSLLAPVTRILCEVEVNIAKAAPAPVREVTRGVQSTVGGVAESTKKTVQDVQRTLTGNNQPQPQPGSRPAERQPESRSGSPQGNQQGSRYYVPRSNSPVLGSFSLPNGGGWGTFGFGVGYGTGWAAFRDYSNIPFAAPGVFTPSPSIRYGGQVPGYAPEYGLLGENSGQAPSMGTLHSAGDANGLADDPADDFGAAGLPTLLAVLALSGVTAALVRTWVLRRTAEA